MRAILRPLAGPNSTTELAPDQIRDGEHPLATIVVNGTAYAVDADVLRHGLILYREVPESQST